MSAARLGLTTGAIAVALISCFAVVPQPAMAAGAKAPKTFCLHFASGGSNWIFTSKSTGKVPTAAGTVALYTVNAAASYGTPYSGSGFMKGTVLHAQLSSEVGGYSYRIELDYDTAAGTGESTLAYTQDDGAAGGTLLDTVASVDCATVTIAGAP